jgi:nondiscriminating glutamyl-tRNA synthetase
MNNTAIRVRFAPAPTGMMHLGNVRTAFMNYIFAQQKQGTFILRIEDTDTERNYDPTAEKIIEDLTWLGITYHEGPVVGGTHKPYFQSMRHHIYQERLAELCNKNRAYRCFCTQEELEKKRERQIALKTPPRYDRTCLSLSEQQINQNIEAKKPFIWRFKLDREGSISIQDMSHGTITFDLKNFSDFPLTRENGTCTFMFANFVDDMMMQITHVIRGEDHLTNTAGQAMLYKAFEYPLPTFWHLPIICNIDGKKLSKRDFGFSLRDLKAAGYLPEAITNYLAVIGASFSQEFMPTSDLIKNFNFDSMNSTGQIKYDVEKLKWFNHKWISQCSDQDIALRCLPYLLQAYPEAQNLEQHTLARLIKIVKTDLITLQDSVKALEFYFRAPAITHQDIIAHIADAQTRLLISNLITDTTHNLEKESFVEVLKKASHTQNISLKDTWTFVRVALTGAPKGLGINDLIDILSTEEIRKRLKAAIE